MFAIDGFKDKKIKKIKIKLNQRQEDESPPRLTDPDPSNPHYVGRFCGKELFVNDKLKESGLRDTDRGGKQICCCRGSRNRDQKAKRL